MNDKIEEQKPPYGGNIVKDTAKELGMTQKELAAYMGVGENTIGNWSRGVVDTPEWAIKMFNLLKIEKKFNTIKQIIGDELNK
ncbi:MAG TPA: transcriptional regulator [Sulfurovum sp. UBA12169]|nr:MAG TPA: transcriptional regulator [Sulfurovum sp. UBA12169]